MTLSGNEADRDPEKGSPASSFAPFRQRTFAVLWTATVVSNIGTWMQNAASGWLMTSINTDPLVVSLVQVATSLPMFLVGLPAGALADILDRRRLLLSAQIAAALLAATFGALVWFERATAPLLLAFTFGSGVTAALIAPSWQAIVPQLVSRTELPQAVALNSVGINVSRAIGPALAGALIAAMGLAAPFWLNAITYVGVIAALVWWRPSGREQRRLPPEHFWSAIRIGLRHTRHNPYLRATLVRAAAFFVFASSYWALLPIFAREQVQGGPQFYGILLGAIGAAAVAGALILPWARNVLSPDRLVAAGTIGTAVALLGFAVAHGPLLALVSSAFAGLSWIAVLATLNVSAQVGLPGWVRGRGLAMFTTVMFASMTFGSAVWGQIGKSMGLPVAHFAAALGLLAAVPFLWRWKLHTEAGVDLSPSMHWPAPVLAHDVEGDRGPVLVTVEYRVAPEDRGAFLAALAENEHQRRRDGAYDWEVFEDLAASGVFVEAFRVDSWLEHLRQHERVTNADRVREEAVRRFHRGGAPRVSHLVQANASSEAEHRSDSSIPTDPYRNPVGQ